MNKFEELGLSNDLLNVIDHLNFDQPTEIQTKSIPLVIKGKDVIGESATGSGKTLAYGCGIVEQVKPHEGLQALILTPTRELAEQVKKAIQQFAQNKHLNVLAVYGGVAIGPQIRDLPKTNVLVSTPGRFLDHLQRRTVNTSKINLLILDEADRMLDMGFMNDVEKIIESCPKERQTLLFSATIDSRLNQLASKFTNHPVNISAKKHVDSSKLKQVYYDVPKGIKLSLLIHLLKERKEGLAMIFCNTRSTTDFVVKNLKGNQIKAIALHGGLTQNKRSRIIDLFNKGKIDILICTDVAARGLHIENVSQIYNYDIPKDPTDYIHRIGRTARAGEEGEVINLLCEYDYDNFSRVTDTHRTFSIEKMEKPHVQRVFTIRNETRRPKRQFNRFKRRY